jgi:pyruvate/2-oxoacid:ferredoxin oxidoreductase beta subunit
MICPICQSKLKNEREYINHLEKKHKEEGDCGCDKGGSGCISGGGIKTTTKLEKTIKRARKKVEDVEKSMNMNALEFGLKMKKKELDKIPVDIRDKVKSVLLENQYLRGIIDGNNRQIQAMKKQVELCIMQIGARK